MTKFRRYASGDKPVFTASQLNAINEAALAHSQGKSQTLQAERLRQRTGNHFPVANGTEDNLPAFSVLELQRALIEPDTDENAYKSAIQFNGVKPTAESILTFSITQQYLSAGAIDAGAVVSGVSFARITGPTGATLAKVANNAYTLLSDEAGNIPVLYDPGEDTGERIAIVRLSGGGGSASDGGSSGGGGLATNNCCDTIYQAGSVDLDGLEWATDYTITLASPIGTVTVTDQGSGTWESDVVEVTCTVDEVTVTDEYTVTMTATGNAPGEVIVTVALTLGGGYGGAAGCCETTEGGFAWKYTNCCIVDPLAGWSMTRDPSGFSGKECQIGGCEICVTPGNIGVANTLCEDSWYNPSVPSITTSATAPFADSYRVYEKDVNFFDRYMIVPTFGTLNLTSTCFIWFVGSPQKSFTIDPCVLPIARSLFTTRRDVVEHTLVSPAMRWLHTTFNPQQETCTYAETSAACDGSTVAVEHKGSQVSLRNDLAGITFRPCTSAASGSLGLLEYTFYFTFNAYLKEPGSGIPGVFDYVRMSTYEYTSTWEVFSTTTPKAASVNPASRFTLNKLSESWLGSGNDHWAWDGGVVIESLEMVPVP